MNLHFVTFATSDWKESRNRLQQQCEFYNNKYDLFKTISFYDENDLDEEFKDKIVSKFPKRDGYYSWSWKPYVIYKTMMKVPLNSYILYCDGGCSFDCSNLFLTYIDSILNELNANQYIGVIKSHVLKAINQTRKEILDRFELTNDEYFLYTFPVYKTGLIVLKNTQKCRKLIKQWMNYYLDNYKTDCDFDRFDKNNQLPDFKYSNYDQAILQCLIYKNDINILNINKLSFMCQRIRK